MRPGIYLRGQIDYDAIEAVNYSTLKHMAKSPLHYQHALNSKRAETKPMALGTAAHIAVLEPERFASEYAIFAGKRRAGKVWEAFEAEAVASGKKVLKESELDEALAIRDAVRADAVASSYLIGGHVEVTLVWIDEETGVLCKGRVDFLRGKANGITDLKTSGDIEHRAFSNTCARLQYHMQAAMYSDGLAALTKKPTSYAVVAVESKEPHDVVPYLLRDDVLDPGRDEYRRLLSKVKECRESGEWPGYANGQEMDLKLPAWVVGDAENDLAALGLE